MNEGADTATAAPPTKTFVAIEGKAREEIPAVPFVGIAYGFIWVVMLGYVLNVARGLTRVRSDLADLQKKLGGK